MKKLTILFSLFAFVLTFGMTSCDDEENPCMDCTVLGITSTICQDDFQTVEEYDAAIQAAELLGDCN